MSSCDIIIPVWNQLQLTSDCISSIEKNTSYPYRLIVIDNASDEDRNSKLLYEMREKDNRKAYFETIIAIAVPSGPALIYKGRCHGEIAPETKGENGFGYDPLFYYPPMKKTFAQMTSEEKNSVSHRGRAMKELKNEFDKVLLWIKQRLAVKPFGDPSTCMHNQE